MNGINKCSRATGEFSRATGEFSRADHKGLDRMELWLVNLLHTEAWSSTEGSTLVQASGSGCHIQGSQKLPNEW